MAKALDDSWPEKAEAWVGIIPATEACGAVVSDGRGFAVVAELIELEDGSIAYIGVPGYTTTTASGMNYQGVPLDQIPPWVTGFDSEVVNGQVTSPEAKTPPSEDPEF